uniref:Ammonium transporter n=1 Tax=Arcella intermedia TaxID=1963864 RepID=A0A6B2L4J5_9EUKA|eukprot:TRINITY_DN10621_c1_g2_i1.p1 TRINITY_DN10621_c1_g2~~TRINITY_DN10621_c1_g2_i1.p1  ORF type:complete len:456 (+),score=71.82 TRINITY_DN10621_c1_g2_i1:121-1368(+)
MMPGLALFEAGLLPAKHTISIMMQVISGLLVLSSMWTIIGFSLAFGDTVAGVIGSPASYPMLINLRKGECIPFAPTIPGFVYAIFQMMFASITPLLMTGSFASRFKFSAFFVFIILWEIIVYYPLAHWIWGGGWLSPSGTGFPEGEGVIDFAGGITIHTSAGVGALVTAVMLGRRKNFLRKGGKYRASNLTTALLGATFLWLGWFGFNAGSAVSASEVTAIALANTQLAACISGLSWMLLDWYHSGKPTLVETLNGTVAGLAGITPASGFVNPEWALLIGLILGLSSYVGVHILKHKLHIDDALDVCVVHGLTGMIGSLCIGLFASKDINPLGQNGAFYGHPLQIVYQFLGVIVTSGWSAFWTFVLLVIIDKVIGIRVTMEVEEKGLGVSEHGEHLDDFHFKARKTLPIILNHDE